MTSVLSRPLLSGTNHGSAMRAATAMAPKMTESRALKSDNGKMHLLLVAHIMTARHCGEQAARPQQQGSEEKDHRQPVAEQR